MKAPRGKRVAMGVVVVGLAVLCTAGWLARQHLRFWWLFEPLGRNQEGYLEFRHRQTGIVMVKVPAGRFTMGASDEEHEELLRSVHPDSKAELEGFRPAYGPLP